MKRAAKEIVPFGERGWLASLCDFEGVVEAGMAANRIADALRKAAGIDDAIAGVASVAIRFDPKCLNPVAARALLEAELARTSSYAPSPGTPVVIPVCYGGAFGPDLADLCARARMNQDDFIRAHSQPVYRVATLGFAPGFAYIGELDEQLRAPRLATPRARLPAGSVGIAGAFTGIYPLPSPGGWNLIGRTPRALFDQSSDEPFLLAPGSTVRFEPIDAETFAMTAS